MSKKTTANIIVVGGGMAGLVGATYLAKAGHHVTLFEKAPKLGGLVNSYERQGFTFDGGIRSIENSGMIFPMLNDLGIEMDWVQSKVSIGIENDVLKLKDRADLKSYEALLKKHFPDSQGDIDTIMGIIHKVMGHMEVLYGIDNPIFMEMNDPKYALTVLVPWLFKYMRSIGKILKMNEPVEKFIEKHTNDQQLNDNITQHFFKHTPAFFALSYFSLYLDYHYPIGGTGTLPAKIEEKAREFGLQVQLKNGIVEVDPENQTVYDSRGNMHSYDKLLWAADLKTLYRQIDINKLNRQKLIKIVRERCKELTPLQGSDSVFTLNVAVDIDADYFRDLCSEHFFYTPDKAGLSSVDTTAVDAIVKSAKISDPSEAKQIIKNYLHDFFKYNTFEISIPVLRDAALAPKGRTGLVISTLFDYHLVYKIKQMGWYSEFKAYCEECILNTLNDSIYPGIKEKVIMRFSSSPLSIEHWVSSTHGAIIGWAFTNPTIPVVHKITKMFSSVFTPLPHIYQAGQWSYSPSGIPISVFTGKRAADIILRKTSKK